MADWAAIGKYAAGVGFPAAVAIYLLVRLDTTLKDLTAAVWAVKATVDLIRIAP